jgi:hypothetical protein
VSDTEYSVSMLTEQQHEQQLRLQAVHLAQQSKPEPQHLIAIANEIYKFIKGETK